MNSFSSLPDYGYNVDGVNKTNTAHTNGSTYQSLVRTRRRRQCMPKSCQRIISRLRLHQSPDDQAHALKVATGLFVALEKTLIVFFNGVDVFLCDFNAKCGQYGED